MIRTLPKPSKPIKLDVSLAIVNIVLLLILFFLATGQLLHPPKSDLDLAETTELPLDVLPSPILVVADDGSWELDGQPVAPDLIDVAIASLPQPVTLHVLINRQAPATSLLTVLNTPALQGLEMRLVTLRKPQQSP